MGALLATVGIVLYVVAYGRPSPTGPDGEITFADHAAYMVTNYAEEPTLFAVLQDAANVWFHSGTTALFADLTGVFRAEMSAHRRTIPRWSAALGVVAAGVAGIQAFAMLIGGIAFMQVLEGALFAIAFGAVLIAYPLGSPGRGDLERGVQRDLGLVRLRVRSVIVSVSRGLALPSPRCRSFPHAPHPEDQEPFFFSS